MIDTTMPGERSGLVTGSRWVLLALAALFTLVAFAQFFLVGVSYFDNPVRRRDHANHPLNGAVMLVLAFWLTQRAGALVRSER